MIQQVAPMVSMSNATDPSFWAEQGWKGALGTILLLALALAVYKDKVGFVSIGPSEAGIRELFGLRLWRIGPGPHFNIEGFWKARKTSIAVVQVDLAGEYPCDGYTKQYTCAVWLQVQDTKKALVAHMYRAQDLNRENMENSEAFKQASALLKRNMRVVLEEGLAPTVAEQQLEFITHKELLDKYGYEIDQVLVTELTDRPTSELARAVRASGSATDAILATTPPRLEAIDGGNSG